MRALTFGPHGEGDIVYLILDDQRRVDILVLWLGLTSSTSTTRPGASGTEHARPEHVGLLPWSDH